MANNGFFEQVHRFVAMIPKGRVATYGQIAKLTGRPRSARLVGWAMAGAPDGLPSHRVVNRLGQLAPGHVFGGRQRQMLESEGITFLEDGRINMEKHLHDWFEYYIDEFGGIS